MTLTRKRKTRTAKRVTRKRAAAAPDTRQMLTRIDAMIDELRVMRKELAGTVRLASEAGLTDRLFGAAGHGTREEFDLDLDWKRFGEWQSR